MIKIVLLLGFGFLSYGKNYTFMYVPKNIERPVKCKIPKHKSAPLKPFYGKLKPQEIENDFIRSIAMGKSTTVDCLIKKGVLKQNKYYVTKSLFVSIIFTPILAQRFINLGANLNAPLIGTGVLTKEYPSGRGSALHLAIGYNRLYVFRSLIKKGFDIKNSFDFRRTHLQHAISLNRYEMAEILLQKGADPNRMLRNKTAYDFVRTSKEPVRFKKLLEKYAKEKPRSKLF
ncbi:MAG: ankyrin repeat domain-containing protein [Bdellovibrionales bacterium]